MNNPIRTLSDLKMIRQGRLAHALCRIKKHRVVKSGVRGRVMSWSCARQGCNWTKRKG